MTEVLLKELTNSDIDWILATGQREEITAGTILIRQGTPVDALYILLDGALSVSVAQADDNPIGRAFAALEGGELSGREVALLANGEVVGEMPFLASYQSSTTVKAARKSLVLMIPQQQLIQKLQEDVTFAAHFYRAIAVLLSHRLEQMIGQIGQSTVVLFQPQIREILFTFAELNDSDIGWMIVAGNAIRLPAGTVLFQAGRPVDALYILLDGKMVASIAEDTSNPLTRAFSTLEQTDHIEREFARLSRGDIVGETPFVEASPPAMTIRAVEDATVLSIPRWRLSAKLLHDVGFAARFYRVLAILLADKQQGIINSLGYGRINYSSGKSLDERLTYEDELSSSFLAQVTLAGTRFDWMLKQIRGN
ncbi:cyclic nucleotide-binding domain-containing protein [Nostoc sp. UCD121]|uniref:cyclic nucleotide-binding domain-containing protein n=1 Tax=unclassified Nostoc TaxID=2593658 RepID=UPI0016283853|nr:MULTISPECIES: cyclic nucleotide-binding domain-containing protein [unclassified Nostoc]MBC1223664.1 cyclic nucleotide-binding domain-containing protein [Nostoc sp. UCD120]MBC1279370.1 cyclic nucleotide-binding domain-containing protein [Nostoc sp. UCD121]MBC1296608.1 cyclic nucleotide-binding domain-containing protein [Nostoc sp. UCD122]